MHPAQSKSETLHDHLCQHGLSDDLVRKGCRTGAEETLLRDLIGGWWIPINLSFLSSGATQWSRGAALSSPKITSGAAGRSWTLVTVHVQVFCPSVHQYIPEKVGLEARGSQGSWCDVSCSERVVVYHSVEFVVVQKYIGCIVMVRNWIALQSIAGQDQHLQCPCVPIHSPPPATPFNAMQFQPIHFNYATVVIIIFIFIIANIPIKKVFEIAANLSMMHMIFGLLSIGSFFILVIH